jgi:uncharacterized membrane protein
MLDVKEKASGLAKGSLICGIFAIIPFAGIAFSLAAIIMGIIDLVKIKNGKSSVPGKKLDITGIILAVILPIIGILLFYIVSVFIMVSGDPIWSELGSSISGLFKAIFRR